MMDNYKLFEADESHCDLLYEWINDSEVRKNSFNIEKIEYNKHRTWFIDKLDCENTYMYIFKKDNKDIGLIRLEKLDEKSLLVNYSIDIKYRGKGYGTKLLKIVKNKHSDYVLIGKVKKENIASIKAFYKSGYIMKEELGHIQFFSNRK